MFYSPIDLTRGNGILFVAFLPPWSLAIGWCYLRAPAPGFAGRQFLIIHNELLYSVVHCPFATEDRVYRPLPGSMEAVSVSPATGGCQGYHKVHRAPLALPESWKLSAFNPTLGSSSPPPARRTRLRCLLPDRREFRPVEAINPHSPAPEKKREKRRQSLPVPVDCLLTRTYQSLPLPINLNRTDTQSSLFVFSRFLHHQQSLIPRRRFPYAIRARA